MSMHKNLLGQNIGGASTNFDRIPAVHMPVNVPQSDKTLGDYVARKMKHDAINQVNQEKKMTFDEWYSQSSWAARTKPLTLDEESIHRLFYNVWKTAQENK